MFAATTLRPPIFVFYAILTILLAMAGDDEPDSDLVKLQTWSAEKKVSPETLKILVIQGFDSLDAFALLTSDDIADINAGLAAKSKITRGQVKLVLKAVHELTAPGDSTAQPQGLPNTDDSSAQQQSPANAEETSDVYVKALKRLLQTQQTQQASGSSATVSASACATTATAPSSSAPTDMASWQDPQVHLKTAGKKEIDFFDIVDFVDIAGARPVEQVLTEGPDGTKFVLKTGPLKPRLESLSVQQWSLANLAIMDKLVRDGMLDKQGILDYMSHTAYMYRLMLTKEESSVFLYDREYRREQVLHGFRWGTHVLHLNDVCLRPKQGAASRPRTATAGKPLGPLSSTGKVICKRYNTAYGCKLTDCKFAHICSTPGCEKQHPTTLHETMK